MVVAVPEAGGRDGRDPEMGPPPDGRAATPGARSASSSPAQRKEPNVRIARNADEALPISAEGYAQRYRELDRLRDEARRELANGLREARDDGDPAENLALQDLLEGRHSWSGESLCSRRSWQPPRSSRRPGTAVPASAASSASATVTARRSSTSWSARSRQISTPAVSRSALLSDRRCWDGAP